MLQITGVGVAGYNGVYTIVSVPTATTFTYTDPLTGLANSGGGTVSMVSATLDKYGQGDVILSGANLYAGMTEVKEGVLVTDNPNALGSATNISEVQTITFSPPTPTTFNLSFNGAGPVSFTYTGGANDLANLQTALLSLASIPTTVPASLNVTQAGNVFTITLQGIPEPGSTCR